MMSRRDRRRQETIDDIKDMARNQLANGGPVGISMRAIARHLAMTASAVHYYAEAVKRRNPQVDQASSSVVNVLFSMMRGAVAAGEIDTERIEVATPASLRRQLATWRHENDGLDDLPTAPCGWSSGAP